MAVLGRLAAAVPPRGEVFAFLGLGSNLGDRLANLQRAVELLHADERGRVDLVSSVYETAPVGGPEQGPFLNLAVRYVTRRSPLGLLRRCQQVEADLGRIRTERWGPRTVDVDILLYADQVVATKALQVPHPRLDQRAFVIVPLVEVAPGLRLPDGRTLPQVLTRLAPIEGITQVGAQVHTPGARAGP